MIDEKLQPLKGANRGLGGILKGNDNVPHPYLWDDVNDEEEFQRAIDYKGKFKRWAYDHNIGNYFPKRESRLIWLGKSSNYEEENFFYIKLDDYEKPVLAQLRVSNHNTYLPQWKESHSEGEYCSGCDFCLNLVIGRDESFVIDNSSLEGNQDYKITAINCEFNPEDKTPEQLEKIEMFIKKVKEGKQPMITFQEIKELFDENPNVESWGDDVVRDSNFNPRKNLVRSNTKNYPFIVKKTNIPTNNDPQYVHQFNGNDLIDLLDNAQDIMPINDKANVYKMFVYNGINYIYDSNDDLVYPLCGKHGNKIYLDKPIAIRWDDDSLTECRRRGIFTRLIIEEFKTKHWSIFQRMIL